MADNKEPIAKFPDLYSEADIARRKQLKKEVEALHTAYGTHFAPEAWEAKPAWEKALRRIGETAYLPEWFGVEKARAWERFTPWLEVGFTPEMADRMKAQTESELRELQRREQVAKDLPRIREHMEALAMLGKLTGEEAQLYELFPDLNPARSGSLNLTEEERQWFLDYATRLAKEGMPAGTPFPSPETLEELMAQFGIIAPSINPRFILSTVAYSKNVEQIGTALQQAYPPKETDVSPEQMAQDKIWKELWARGILPTGNIEQDIKLLEEVMMKEREAEGVPYVMTTEDGQAIPVTKKEDGFYYQEMKIANIDPETGEWVSLSLVEEFEQDHEIPRVPIGATLSEAEWRRKIFSVRGWGSAVSDEAIEALYETDGSAEQIYDWSKEWLYSPWGLEQGYAPIGSYNSKFLMQAYEDGMGSPPLREDSNWMNLRLAWYAGWGDVIANVGNLLRWQGVEGAGLALVERGERMQNAVPDYMLQELPEFGWKSFTDGRWWTLKFSRTIPFQMCLLPLTLFGVQSGAALMGGVAIKFGLGAFWRIILQMFGTGIGGVAMGRVPESLMESAGTFDQILDNGGSLREADEGANEAFWSYMKLAGLDAAELAILFAPSPPGVPKAGISGGLFRTFRVGGKVMVGGTVEGFDEYYQLGTERRILGIADPWAFDPTAQEAAAIGGLMGMGWGGGADVLTEIMHDTQSFMSIPQARKFDTDVKEAKDALIAQGASEKQANRYANVVATSRLAETEEGNELVTGIVNVVKERSGNREIKNPTARVYDQEIAFLKKKLADVELQIKNAQDSYSIHSERAKREGMSAWEVEEAQGSMKNLRELIMGLKDRRNQINDRLKEIPVTKVTKGKALEHGILTTTEGKVTVKFNMSADLKGTSSQFAVEDLVIATYPDGSLVVQKGALLVRKKDGTPAGYISIDNAYALAQQGIEPFKSFIKELEKAVTTRERVLAGEKVIPTVVTPIENIKWDKNVPLEFKERVIAALVNLQDVVRINIREVKMNRKMKLSDACYIPRRRALEFRTSEGSEYLIYHEIGHSLSSVDIDSGDFIIWEAYAGEEAVEKIKVEMGKMLEEHPNIRGEWHKDWLYKYNEWFKESEEMFASDFAGFFSGTTTITAQHFEGLEKVFGRVLEANIAQSKWNTISLAERVAWVHKAGLSAKLVEIAWSDITAEQRETLTNTVAPKVKSFVKEDVISKVALETEVIPTADLESILSAEEVDMSEAEKQSKAVKGYQETTITTDEIARTAEEAIRHIDEHFFYADPENNIDRAFTAAWHHGDLNEALSLLPDNIWDYNKKFIEENIPNAKFQDTREGNFNSMDTNRAVGFADWGKFGGIIRRRILRIAERGTMAYLNTHGVNISEYIKLERSTGLDKLRPNFLSVKARKKFESTTWNLMDNFKQEYVGVSNEDLMAKEEIQNVIGSYSEAEQNVMIDWARGLRMVWDELITQQNAFRVKYGLEPIPYRDSYVKWAYEANIWSRMLGVFYDGKLRPDFVRDPATTPDFIKPSEPFVPHAMEREGGLKGYSKIMDVRRLFADYSEAACKDMFFTPIIQNTKSYIPLIEKSAPRFARWLMDWVSESYAGSMNFVTKAIHKTPFVFATRPIIWLRRRLTTAVFPLNWSWNLFVQTSSIALTVEQYGLRNTLAATKFLWCKDVRSLVQENMYSHIIKQRRIGSLLYQDLGATITKTEKIQRSNLETVEEAMNFLTRIIENNVTGLSCYAGYLKGKQLGITGRDLIDFASDAGAKTQSMYNLQNIPGVLRSKEIGALFPFQTFCFEAMNAQREMGGIKFLKAGTYETVAANTAEGKGLLRNRMRSFLTFFAAIYVLNIIGELGIDRKPWQPTSFIPMVSILMAGIEPYNPWNYPMPLRYVSEFNRGMYQFFGAPEGDPNYDKWSGLRNWFIRYHTPGGVQIVRTIEGITALIDGEKRDVAGDKMFDVEPDEWLRAIFVGVYSTRGGEEYRRTRLEGGEPTTDAILKELDEMEGKLGTSDKGEWYTLSDYGTEFLQMVKDSELPLWQVMDESLAFPELARFRVHCEYMWTEYYKTPEKDRIAYRRANPYVDASLVFWERVQNPRSSEGKEELKGLLDMFNLGEHPRWHSKGLPEIPEFYKLLPE